MAFRLKVVYWFCLVNMQAKFIFMYMYSSSCSSSSVVIVIFSVVWIYFLSADGEYHFAKWPRQTEPHFFCK